MTPTCLDCVHLDIETKPTEGHQCYHCKGKLVAVKANGSGFHAKNCDTCEHMKAFGCSNRILCKRDCVNGSAWKKATGKKEVPT